MEPTSDDALLIAYLDGELSPQELVSIEQRLKNEPELRKKLSSLEQTRSYLDLLEIDEANPEQIETTLQTIALSLSATHLPELKIGRLQVNAKTWGILSLVGLAFFAFFLHLGLRSPFDDPSFRRQVERFDLYLAIVNDDDGYQLLQQLALKRLFLPPLPQHVDWPDASEYEPSGQAWYNPMRIFWNESATTELSQLFYKNIRSYRLLPREKRRQIQKLHRDIESSPRQAELLLTLQNYYHWHQSLQSYEKIALRQPKPLSERVSDIVELKTRLDALSSEFGTWMPSEVVSIEESKHLAETLAKLPFEYQERLLNEEPILIIDELRQYK